MDLASHRFIASFEPEQVEQLCQLAVLEDYPDQKVIFEEGEIPDYLYLVLSGEVEFRKCTGANKYQTIAKAIPNEFFGEFGVIDGQPRSAEAITCGEATLAKIPRDRLMEILDNTKGRVVLHLFRYVVQNLRATTAQYINQMVHQEKMVLIGEMVNKIIHDFKNPVTGIHLASAMLKELHNDEETIEWCDIIQTQVSRMLAMTEEALEFAKGHTVLHKQTLNLFRLLKQFEKLNRSYFEENHVDFVWTASNIQINGDENKFIRVLQNLVGNAVEAFDGRGGKIKIIAEAQDDQWVEIKISDNGPGISEAIQGRLFDAFVTYGKRGGTGLGTAIAKSIIEAHGGRICFESQAGVGTTFKIRLPQMVDNDADILETANQI